MWCVTNDRWKAKGEKSQRGQSPCDPCLLWWHSESWVNLTNGHMPPPFSLHFIPHACARQSQPSTISLKNWDWIVTIVVVIVVHPLNEFHDINFYMDTPASLHMHHLPSANTELAREESHSSNPDATAVRWTTGGCPRVSSFAATVHLSLTSTCR